VNPTVRQLFLVATILLALTPRSLAQEREPHSLPKNQIVPDRLIQIRPLVTQQRQ
jgi:hypothetical protein